ncbi:MAG: energy transducer TonB [Burkholderiaceae bacterium]|jgi:TonB family protein|nr:energy transducer TonB [Burkholderiaceae bacterium]
MPLRHSFATRPIFRFAILVFVVLVHVIVLALLNRATFRVEPAHSLVITGFPVLNGEAAQSGEQKPRGDALSSTDTSALPKKHGTTRSRHEAPQTTLPAPLVPTPDSTSPVHPISTPLTSPTPGTAEGTAEGGQSKPGESSAESGTGTISPPQVNAVGANTPKPAYPSASRRLSEEGTVTLSVYIRESGHVGEIRLKQSSGHHRLDQAAMRTVRAWRYIPAKKGGLPIPRWYLQTIVFSLTH